MITDSILFEFDVDISAPVAEVVDNVVGQSVVAFGTMVGTSSHLVIAAAAESAFKITLFHIPFLSCIPLSR